MKSLTNCSSASSSAAGAKRSFSHGTAATFCTQFEKWSSCLALFSASSQELSVTSCAAQAFGLVPFVSADGYLPYGGCPSSTRWGMHVCFLSLDTDTRCWSCNGWTSKRMLSMYIQLSSTLKMPLEHQLGWVSGYQPPLHTKRSSQV